MLKRREELLTDKLEAASEQLATARGRYESALSDLNHVKAVQAAQVGMYLNYIIRGNAGGGHVIGRTGESFILMSGPEDQRDIRKVHARYIVEVVENV